MAKYRNDKIRGKQAELDLTVDQLAMRAGVSDRTVSAIRKGMPVSSTSLERVVEALQMTMVEVYEPKPEADPALT
jgi:transcriptional regulator with XRE-family HTH domain